MVSRHIQVTGLQLFCNFLTASVKVCPSIITGRGFSGSYRLMYPYYPSPAQLWGPDYKADTKNNKEEVTDRSSKGKKRVVEYFSEEEDQSEDDEVLPAPSKRGAPKAR